MSEQQGPMICNNTTDYASFTLQGYNKHENINNPSEKTVGPKKCYTINTGNKFEIKGHKVTMYKDREGINAAGLASNCGSTIGTIRDGQALVVSDIDSSDFASFDCEKMPNSKALKLIQGNKAVVTSSTKKQIVVAEQEQQQQVQAQAKQPVNNNCTEALRILGFDVNSSASASFCKTIKD